MIMGSQVRGARAVLKLTVAELARSAGVAPNTITRVEADKPVNTSTLGAIQRALETAGVVFIPENGDGAGGAAAKGAGIVRQSAREATAYHEAGHAVAGLLKGLRIRKAVLAEEDNSVGHVHFSISRPKSLKRVHAWGIVSLAGEAAQRHFNPRTLREHHGGGDREQAISIASSWYGSGAQIEAVTTLWAIQAKDLVHAYWPAVTRVAEAFLTHHTMTEQEIRGAAREP